MLRDTAEIAASSAALSVESDNASEAFNSASVQYPFVILKGASF